MNWPVGFFRESKMIISIVANEDLLVTDEDEDKISAIENIIRAHAEGKHFVYAPKRILNEVVRNKERFLVMSLDEIRLL